MRRTLWLLTLWVVSCSTPDTEYCRDDGDCALIVGASEFGSICHPSRHVCISALSCREDADCQNPEASRCDTATNSCVPCLPDAGDDSCSHFKDKRLCARKGSAGVCVGCLENLDCDASAPICDGQSCRKCRIHSDCEGLLHCDDGARCSDSLVCMNGADFGPASAASVDGRCAQNGDGPGGRVIYVHNDSSTCKSGAKGTAIGQPFCTFEEGAAGAVALSRPFVRVIPQSEYTAPPGWSVKSGQLVFIGAPSTAHGTGKLATLNFSSNSLDVSENGNVTLDGFEMTQGANLSLVTCKVTKAPVPVLTLRNSLVRGKTASSSSMGSVAIDLANCQARIQNNIIGVANLIELDDPNHLAHSRVLRLANSPLVPGTSILVENNVIAGNWDNAIDLEQVATPGVTLRFNTIYGNDLRAGLLKTIRCSSVGPYVTIAQSIVQRAPTATHSLFEYAANCRFKQVVVGTQANELTDAELIRETPQLSSIFELSASGNSCCVDRAQPGASETFPATDLGLRTRPQGAGFDLGAFELPVLR